MENLVTLLGALEWLPMGLFQWSPIAIAVVIALISGALLVKSWTDRRRGGLRAVLAALSLGTLSGVLTSAVLGTYVLLQPLRAVDGNRWLEGANRLDLARLDAVDSVDNRIVGPVLNPVIDKLNQQITTVNDVSELSEQSANMVYGFIHTIEQSQQYLTYVIAGSVAALLFLLCFGLASSGGRRHERDQMRALLERVDQLERVLAKDGKLIVEPLSDDPVNPIVAMESSDTNRQAWQRHPDASRYAYAASIDYTNPGQVGDFLSLKRLTG